MRYLRSTAHIARIAASLIAASLFMSAAPAQEVVRYKAAVVALTEDAELRKTFEDSLVALARDHDYDAVTSYDIEPNVQNLDRDRFMSKLAAEGVRAVLMLRPAAIGAGASLDSVRGEVSDTMLRDMQAFAQQVSPSGAENLVAVVHMAIYTLENSEARLLSSGAVWLDEEVERDEGIRRLQDLIATNVDAVRPAIRQRLGLPPLP